MVPANHDYRHANNIRHRNTQMVDWPDGTITIAKRNDASISIDWDLHKVMEWSSVEIYSQT